VETVLRILRGLTRRGRTVVVSTHDHRLLPLADQVIEMSPGHATDLTPSVTFECGVGDELFAEGAEGTRVYRVEQGAIELTRGGQHLHTARQGEVFGEMAPLFSLPRSARAVAIEPSTLIGYTVDGFTNEFGGEELRRLVARFDDE
jgi:putative ABC transport system ATP-binding protein